MAEKTRFVSILIAVIGVVGTLGGALIGNWDKIFPSRQPTNNISQILPVDSQEIELTEKGCKVTLAVPLNNAELPERRLGNEKIQLDWMFGWRGCPEASRYHLYVIGPGALNPIINEDEIMSATYTFRRSSYGITKLRGWTWKVRAFADGQWGEWSEERKFDISQPANNISQILPADSQKNELLEKGCKVTLAVPLNNAELPQRRLIA